MLILLLTLALPAIILPVYGAARKSVSRDRLSAYIAIASLLLALAETPFELFFGPHGIWYYPTSLLSFDMISFFFSITIIIVSLMAAIGSISTMETDKNSSIYYSLILFTVIGMVLVSSTTDLLFLLVSWELMTVPTFVLVALKKRDRLSSEASMKYFLAAALSAALILFGLSIAYGLTGSTSFSSIIYAFEHSSRQQLPAFLLTASLLASGFAVKMALAPFHFWLPDALQGTFPQIGALLAAGSKKAGFAAALRIFVSLLASQQFIAFGLSWQLALGIVAAVTITWGNIAALTQKKVSRMLAYSSIAQAGYITIGLAVQGTPGAAIGIVGLLLHVLFHGVMKGSAFVSIANMDDDLGLLNGLYKRAPGTALGFTISLFALAGMPPLNGFWSKLFLFIAAVQAGMSWLAAVALINSAIALAYYSYLAKRVYFEQPADTGRVQQPEKTDVLLVLAFAAIFIIATGLFPAPVLNPILSFLGL
ncbi:MAG: NADH-quinone oxidoreductase subunit N [Conexivisphaerales archaeon]